MTPAFAQQFYIVRAPGAQECTIVAEKPTSTTVTVMGDKVYTSRTEAQTALKEVCTSTTGSSTTTTTTTTPR
jgi:hypothetical protein